MASQLLPQYLHFLCFLSFSLSVFLPPVLFFPPFLFEVGSRASEVREYKFHKGVFDFEGRGKSLDKISCSDSIRFKRKGALQK